eukprot:Tbor_TRINITY_DN7474_c0_g1::TRINITY_DN7474_c0_g1_i1::g.14536::m.14536
MWSVLRRYQNEEYRTGLHDEHAQTHLSDGTPTNVCLPNTTANEYHPSTTAKSRSDITLRSIAMHETKPYAPPLDPMILTAPYDRLIYSKLVNHLKHEVVSMRHYAIEQLLELFGQKSEHVVNALKLANTLDVLTNVSLKDPDLEIRANACRALAFMVQDAEGQRAILGADISRPTHSAIAEARDLIHKAKRGTVSDPKNSVSGSGDSFIMPSTDLEGSCNRYNFTYLRKFLAIVEEEVTVAQPNVDSEAGQENKLMNQTYRTDHLGSLVLSEGLKLLIAVHRCHNDWIASKHLLKIKCTPIYVRLIRHCDDGVCANACAALTALLDVKEAFVYALDAGAIPALTNAFISHTDPTALQEAAKTISKLLFYSAGKRAVHAHNTLAALLPHIANKDDGVRIEIAGAIAAATVYVPGRIQAIELGLLSELFKVLSSEKEKDALCYHMYTICQMSEHPATRHQMRSPNPDGGDIAARLEEITGLTVDYPHLHELAIKALKFIAWNPGDPI